MAAKKFSRYRVYAFDADGGVLDIREVDRDQRSSGYRYKLREVKRDMRQPLPSGRVSRVTVEKVYCGQGEA